MNLAPRPAAFEAWRSAATAALLVAVATGHLRRAGPPRLGHQPGDALPGRGGDRGLPLRPGDGGGERRRRGDGVQLLLRAATLHARGREPRAPDRAGGDARRRAAGELALGTGPGRVAARRRERAPGPPAERPGHRAARRDQRGRGRGRGRTGPAQRLRAGGARHARCRRRAATDRRPGAAGAAVAALRHRRGGGDRAGHRPLAGDRCLGRAARFARPCDRRRAHRAGAGGRRDRARARDRARQRARPGAVAAACRRGAAAGPGRPAAPGAAEHLSCGGVARPAHAAGGDRRRGLVAAGATRAADGGGAGAHAGEHRRTGSLSLRHHREHAAARAPRVGPAGAAAGMAVARGDRRQRPRPAARRALRRAHRGPGRGGLPLVRGDATLLAQLLTNLLDNACKYGRRPARAHRVPRRRMSSSA